MLLFNWVGYRLMYDFLEHRADEQLEARLDRSDYSEDHLIEIKVPLNLPYQQNWKEFERYDGEVTVGGIHYKYVMRKVYNDSLILKCIPNEQKNRIRNAEHHYFQLVNDLQHSGQHQGKAKDSFFKNLITEYWIAKNDFSFLQDLSHLTPYAISSASLINSGYFLSPEQPPEA